MRRYLPSIRIAFFKYFQIDFKYFLLNICVGKKDISARKRTYKALKSELFNTRTPSLLEIRLSLACLFFYGTQRIHNIIEKVNSCLLSIIRTCCLKCNSVNPFTKYNDKTL